MKKLILFLFIFLVIPCQGFCEKYMLNDRIIGIGGGMYLGIFVPSKKTIFSFDVNSTQVISGVFRTTSSSDEIRIYWGDGQTDTYAGTSDQAYSHDYGSPGNYTVKIKAKSESVLTKFTMTQAGADISFDIAALPASLTAFYCTGSNTVSGDIAALPASLTVFYCSGLNTVSGDIAVLPASLTIFYCSGYNTVSGLLSDIKSGVTYFAVAGSNTISGSLSSLPTSITYFSCTGSNTISDYTYGHSWSENMRYVQSDPVSGGLSSSEIDSLLVSLSQTTWTSEKTIILRGTNAARTAASDAAVTTLTGLGVTVVTN